MIMGTVHGMSDDRQQTPRKVRGCCAGSNPRREIDPGRRELGTATQTAATTSRSAAWNLSPQSFVSLPLLPYGGALSAKLSHRTVTLKAKCEPYIERNRIEGGGPPFPAHRAA